MAWTEDDVNFWTAGSAVTSARVVGSQLLWHARSSRLQMPSAEGRGALTFLGQLHGAELPRSLTRKSIAHLLNEGEIIYRPHPAEADIASRLQHRRWRLMGVDVSSSKPLHESPGPVLAHFSTGLLEAAAGGLPAFGYCQRPPAWLEELWTRYRIAQWGLDSEPTKIQFPTEEPSQAVLAYVLGLV